MRVRSFPPRCAYRISRRMRERTHCVDAKIIVTRDVVVAAAATADVATRKHTLIMIIMIITVNREHAHAAHSSMSPYYIWDAE